MSGAPATGDGPLCAVHPSADAVGTCARCGRFLCGECIGDVEPFVCVDCQARGQKPAVAAKSGYDLMMVILLVTLFWNVYDAVRAFFSPAGQFNPEADWAAVMSDARWGIAAAIHVGTALVIGGWSAFLIPRFLAKRSDVPGHLQTLFKVWLGLFLLAAVARYWITPDRPPVWWATAFGVIYCLIVIAYLRHDPRVKATFVR